MAADYDVLAPIYDRVGLADFAVKQSSRLLDLAQRNGWMGRRILDLGCGTGTALLWFLKHSYVGYGIDRNAAMLAEARQRCVTQSLAVQLVEGDIREPMAFDRVDLALALDVIPEMSSLRELETVFMRVADLLSTDKYFVFDVYTIEGLVKQSQIGDEVVLDTDDLTMVVRRTYDYERQVMSITYDVLISRTDGYWKREHAQRTLRAYPLQGIKTLLQRQGFEVVATVDADLRPFDISAPQIDRAVFISKRI